MKPPIQLAFLIIAAIASLALVACTDNQSKPLNNSETISGKPISNIEPNFNQLVQADVARFQAFYAEKFPNVPFSDFSNGVYAIDNASREQWLEMEEFPPYELSVDDGKELFEQPFANGKSYANCFKDFSKGVRQNYPYFEDSSNQVITLELAINQCREKNHESLLDFGSQEMSAISGYLAFLSRGNKFNLKVDSSNAYDAYLAGKKFYYSKRGQLNFACSDCHIKITGTKLRAETVSPGLGHPTGMPVYRSKWGELGSIGRRYQECNKNVRAVPFELQSEVYRNLEFFQTIMSNGLEVNGPSSRK